MSKPRINRETLRYYGYSAVQIFRQSLSEKKTFLVFHVVVHVESDRYSYVKTAKRVLEGSS